MRTYEATVRIGGKSTKVRIDTGDYFTAKNMLESQYGDGSVITLREVM